MNIKICFLVTVILYCKSVQCCKMECIFTGSLITGFFQSDCLLPCLRTEVNIEEGEESIRLGRAYVVLYFNDKVRVKKTSVDRFSFLDSLNFFGSNLGLWPGMGLYQILEWIVAQGLSLVFF